jgi:hypothetical protein
MNAKGFTLIASLLLLLLLSGIAIGLMMMVNTEGKVGGTDLQNNAAYHSAEGGIERMTADVAATFQNVQAPSASQICNLGLPNGAGPTLPGVTWKDYQITPGALGSSCPGSLVGLQKWGQISAGPNQGLWAQIIPINMLATAAEPGGQEVSMVRTAQVALIPVFQFGVFSDSDLSVFPGSPLDFAGPVHTNGDFYPLASTGATLTFHAKVSAYGNVVRTQLPNGFAASGTYDGRVYIPSADGDCPVPPAAPAASAGNCSVMNLAATNYGDGSVIGAGSTQAQIGSAYNNPDWKNFSQGSNYELVNGNYGNTASGTAGTGAKQLSLPFVGGGALPNEIIRRPPAGESATSSLGSSREYNMAQIHVLLSDNPADLCSGCVEDANNVRLANVAGTNGNQFGITVSPIGPALPALGTGSTYNTYFAAASNAVPYQTTCSGVTCSADWPFKPAAQTSGTPNPSLQPAGAPIYLSNGTPTIYLCQPNVSFASSPSPTVPPAANCPTNGAYPYYSPPNGATPSNTASSSAWNLIDGYLRVEYKDVNGNWNPVTMEWLRLGFARGLTPPTVPGTNPAAPGANPVHPNAILLFQVPADRDSSGTLNSVGVAPSCKTTVAGKCTVWNPGTPPEVAADTAALSALSWGWAYGVTSAATTTQSISQYNWYPINFYDVREGEIRDTALTSTDTSCTVNGLMNAVEIDVGNLNRWLTGAIGTSGTSVDYIAQNGYVLYFSDRRGMLYNTNTPYNNTQRSGEAGLEDVINSPVAGGMPNGILDPIPTGRTWSPEDVNENGVLDNWGTANLGLGQWNSSTSNLNVQITAATPDNPYSPRIASCTTTGRKNWVSGARHVLKLVDGSLGNIPHRTDAAATLASPGGFTVASENPVYIQGDYNTNQSDWTGGVDQTGHAAAAVIADAVTVLSDDWDDRNTFKTPVTSLANRNPSHDGYYRVAIAGGKNMAFARPANTNQDFGTDGGLHNFLRYLEDWSNQTFHYKGSLVSLYYATYGTGIFKCCNTVYGVPSRDFLFDTDFSTPGGLPPGTPMFRDVNSLGYRQLFAARTK